jgi:hypothetical protein
MLCAYSENDFDAAQPNSTLVFVDIRECPQVERAVAFSERQLQRWALYGLSPHQIHHSSDLLQRKLHQLIQLILDA